MAELPRVPPEMFRFTTTERADLHTAILHALGEADERLDPPLTLGRLRDRLRAAGRHVAVPEPDLAGALKQLAGWGLLAVTFDHTGDHIGDHTGDFATAEEYERRSPRYALTRHGAAAVAGMRHATAMLSTAGGSPSSGGGLLSSAGASQPAVLDALADRLAELDRLLRDPDPARNRRIFTCLRELDAHLDGLLADIRRLTDDLRRLPSLSHERRQWLAPLSDERQGPPSLAAAEPGAFHVATAATVACLQEFLTGLEHRGGTIAAAVEAVARHGVDVLHTRALDGATQLTQPAPPILPAGDLPAGDLPGGGVPDLSTESGEDRAGAWLAVRAERWEVLRAWFAPADGGAPRLRRLQDLVREAVASLLRVLDRVADARLHSSSAAADFRTLARWFAAAPAEDDAHRLWDAAFGLGPARHAHLGPADPELIPAGVPWAEAEPVEVSALLRSRGRTERMGRTGRVRDVIALRAERRARAEKERAELEAAWSALTTTGALRLSRLAQLDHETFGRLLDLLGRALAERPDSTGFRRAVTGDGRVELLLRDPDDGAVAVLRTPDGWFRGPDYLIDIRALDRGRAVGA
ncbi:MAG TPA: TIGR02677 family protein [Nonomuraea sp.]|nr:TIGR02677 family protein [Nonomuraea sp.]